MRVYYDLFSDEEIVSDAYRFEEVYNKVGIKIKSKMVVVGDENFDVGCGNAFGGEGEDEKVEDTA